MNGQKSIWGREKKGVAGQNSDAGGNSMASGVEITGERVIWPTGLGFLIQEHRENERVKGKSPRPIRRPENAAEVAVAMADGMEFTVHVKRGLRATKLANNRTGRKRRGRGSHSGEEWRRRRLGDGCPRGGEDGGRRSFSERRFRLRAKAKTGAGAAGGRAGVVSALICSGRGTGGGGGETLPRRGR